MKLQLISPNERFEYRYWQEDSPPAVVVVTSEDHKTQRVWVRGANSNADSHFYFEQQGVITAYAPELDTIT